jgi:hypothetical protein
MEEIPVSRFGEGQKKWTHLMKNGKRIFGIPLCLVGDSLISKWAFEAIVGKSITTNPRYFSSGRFFKWGRG